MQQQLMLKGAMNLKGNKEEYKGGFSEQRERRLYYNLKKKKKTEKVKFLKVQSSCSYRKTGSSYRKTEVYSKTGCS